MKLHYPILVAFIERSAIPLKDLALELGISSRVIRSKCDGRACWTLDECILLRNILAPELTIEELFYTLPKIPDKDKQLTQEEMRGGFNPELYGKEL